MEVDKVEKHIKEQLNYREIPPSEAAWEKLSSQLPKVEHRKSNTFFWYSVAASFIGILLITSIYFGNRDEPINTGIEVVDAPKEPDAILQMEEVFSVQKKEEEQLVEAKKEANVTKETPRESNDVLQVEDKSQLIVVQKTDNMEIESNAIKTNTEQLIDAKIAELIRQVDIMEEKNLQVTDLEVDSLLRKAENEILFQKIKNQKGKIDAMALLDEVESELDQTFRAQILESLKEGFLKVRTAVADRNN